MVSEAVSFIFYLETGTVSTGIWAFFANDESAPEKRRGTSIFIHLEPMKKARLILEAQD